MEESITLAELQAVLKASYEKEFRHHRFLAALKGHNLDAPNQSDTKTKFEEIKARAEAKANGASSEQAELEFFGLDVETE